MFNTLRDQTLREPKRFRLNCYIFEIKLKNIEGHAGFRSGRIYSTNAFRAVTFLSTHENGNVAEVYYLKRLRGECNDVKEQTIQFDE